MPEYPASKRRVVARGKEGCSLKESGDVELHCRSNFSFLEGGSHPDELFERGAALGLSALALTDRNSLAGVVRGHVAAKSTGVRLIVGAELTLVDAGVVVVWAMDRGGYGRLSKLISRGRRRAPKGECHLTFADLADHAEGLLAGVLLHPAHAREATGSRGGKDDVLFPYRELFRDRLYGVAELRRGDDDAAILAVMKKRCRAARVPMVAAGDVYYHHPSRQKLQDVLTAIRMGTTVAEAKEKLFANGERYLRSGEEMRELFAEAAESVARAREVGERARFSLEELRYEYPEELVPAGETAIDYLRRLAWKGAKKRYAEGVPEKIRGLLEHELALIEEMRYEAYFLTVWDLVRYARGRGILCQGRGSAANSAVCYCLGVTSVDPEHFQLLFERFISKERGEAPDIDIDFEHQRREEVLQYIYEKYGRERAGMTAEVITYQLRSAARDVGKALGLSLDRVDALAGAMEGFRGQEEMALADRLEEAGIDATSLVGRQLLELLPEILDFPRHLSQHVGGMVMTRGPLDELAPIENAAMEGRTVIPWDKDDLDALGILKVDCLGLGMLSALHRAFDLLALHHGRRLTLASVPREDPRVYDMICAADTIGVFQIESRAQMSMLPRLRPRCFYDLVIEVAIVRPGPIQGDMVHPYLRRRTGEERVEYPSPVFAEVLGKTLGVPLFQEQAMRLAMVAAGFTPGEADELRRAMAAWRRKGVIDQFRRKLVDGFQANGLSAEMGERVFKQIRGFGEYGFPESHAASFALLVYVSAWLKRHYPAAFVAAILNSLPMGFYAPAQLVRDAREHGVEVRPPDVNASDWDCTLEASADDPEHPALRLGLRMVDGLGERAGHLMVAARGAGGGFRSVDDLARRSGIDRKGLAKLTAADAFGSLGLDRRQALWNALPAREAMPLFPEADFDEEPMLPKREPFEEVVADYRSVGLSLRAHPISFLRESLGHLEVARARDLSAIKDRSFVKVAGLVLLRQQPATAKGIRFITLEDETGVVNLVVRQRIWYRYRRMATGASALVALGTLEKKGQVIHVVVSALENLTDALMDLKTKSRDFC